MQLGEKLWRESLLAHGYPAGGEHTTGPCAAFMVQCPCPEDGRDANGHCEWCCGSGRVTERVRKAMGDERALRAGLTEALDELVKWMDDSVGSTDPSAEADPLVVRLRKLSPP